MHLNGYLMPLQGKIRIGDLPLAKGTLQDIRLFDVSIVTYPAYPQTSVKVRDYINALAEPDCQGSPAEGVDGLEILKRRQDFLKLTK